VAYVHQSSGWQGGRSCNQDVTGIVRPWCRAGNTVRPGPHRRLQRLERAGGGDGPGCGPGCPPVYGHLYRRQGPDGEKVLVKIMGHTEPCPRCGQPAERVEDFTEVVVAGREEALAVMRA